MGCDISGASEALFLRGFSDDITLIPQQDVELTPLECSQLEHAGIKTVSGAAARYTVTPDEMIVQIEASAEPLTFDVLYPALGSRPRNRLAKCVGLRLDEAGKAAPTSPSGSDLAGLFCAGDIVEGLDQICVAIAHGAIAATTAHNWLRDRDGETTDAILHGIQSSFDAGT